MDSPHWERIQALFHEAVDLPPSDRESFFEDRLRWRHSLMADVLALLEGDALSSSLLDRDLFTSRRQVLDEMTPSLPALQELWSLQNQRNPRPGRHGSGIPRPSVTISAAWSRSRSCAMPGFHPLAESVLPVNR